jgi:hypothetical protein
MNPSLSSIEGKRGTDLGPAIGALLRTPTAQLAVNGGSQHPDKRRAGGHGPTLADEVEHLLPTPRPQAKGGGGSPEAEDGGLRPSGAKRARNLVTVTAHLLLPTPRATDGTKGGPNQRGSSGDLMLPSAVMDLLPTPRTSDTGTPGRRSSEGFRPPLSQVLLPTPLAADGDRTSTKTRRGDPTLIGALTDQPSPGGSTSPDGEHPGQLSLDGPESD